MGNIYGYNSDLTVKTQIINGSANQLNGICGFVISDSDNDGSLEVVMGEGCTTNSGQHIQVYDFLTADFEWSHLDLDGPFSALTYVATTNKILGHSYTIEGGNTAGILVEIDPATGDELGQFANVFASHELFGMKNVKLEETQPEKLLLYGQYKVSLVSVGDYSELKSYDESFDTYYSADVADLDNDGVKEILVGNHSGVDIFDANLNKIGSLVADFDVTTEI
ncbi:MAG: hypothetical protein IPM82_19630 [Saprospiraceae bacterium]|nr:hypothetical protein [Saprospiraceae bacterium]